MTIQYTAFNNPALLQAIKASNYFQALNIEITNPEISQANALGIRSGKWFSRRTWLIDFPLDYLAETLEKAKKQCQRDVYIEIRNFDHKALDEKFLQQHGFQKHDWLNIIVDTEKPVPQILDEIHESKRRQINRSVERGGSVHLAEHEEEVHAFYEILKKVYKRRVKKPLPDWEFFKTFFHANKEKRYGVYLLIKYHGKVVAGMMCPITPGKCIYEWYIAGMDRDYNPLGIYPSVLVTWAAIEYAINFKLQQFNFMGAGSPHETYGVRNFKKQFGGDLVNVGRYVKMNKELIYKAGRFYFKGFSANIRHYLM